MVIIDSVQLSDIHHFVMINVIKQFDVQSLWYFDCVLLKQNHDIKGSIILNISLLRSKETRLNIMSIVFYFKTVRTKYTQ